MLETYTAFIENDLHDIWTLLERKAYGEAFRRYAPVWEDMLFIREEAEWLDFLEQEGPELEERPLRLHLAAWAKCCLEIGCYEGDVTGKLVDFLRACSHKPRHTFFRQILPTAALKIFDVRQYACKFLPCIRLKFAQKSAYLVYVNRP